MAKQRQVSVASGAGFTNVLATLPCHYLKIWRDNDRNAASLEYKLPDDNFTATFTTDSSIGDIIERIGRGRQGILGVPPNFNASGVPATGDILIKLHSADSAAITVNVYEDEREL